MRHLLSIISFFLYFEVRAQDYQLTPVEDHSACFSSDSISWGKKTELDGFVFSHYVLKGDAENRFRFVIQNSSGKILQYVVSPWGEPSGLYPSYFVKPGDRSMVILVEMADEYTLGYMVFTVKGRRPVYAGNMAVAVFADNPESVIPCTTITDRQDEIRITFSCEDLVLDPGADNYQVKKGRNMGYAVKNGKLGWISF